MTAGPSRLALAALSALSALSACAARDAVATAAASEPVMHCSASGPAVLLDGICTGALASAVFQSAVCGCGALQFGFNLSTDGFDSRQGPYAPGGGGGDVGSNAGLAFPGVLDIGGTLTIAGGGAEVGTQLRVGGDLAVAGSLGRSSSMVSVGGAAQIGGDIFLDQLDVAGALTQPPGATAERTINAGQRVVAEVAIAPPCKCTAADGVDVAGLVARHSSENDDAAIDLRPGAYVDFSGDPVLEVPCGLFYLDGIRSITGGTLTLRARGRSAVFVRNEIAPVKVEVAAGAEIDLFVEGALNLAAAEMGDPARPWALRIYKTGGGPVNVPVGFRLHGSLYAPDDDLAASAAFDVFGSLVVRNLIGGGDRKVHYDRAIAAVVQACE